MAKHGAISTRRWAGANMADDLAHNRYDPQAVRRAYLPKKRGKRALGIPTIRDRIVQAAVTEVLETVYDLHIS